MTEEKRSIDHEELLDLLECIRDAVKLADIIDGSIRQAQSRHEELVRLLDGARDILKRWHLTPPSSRLTLADYLERYTHVRIESPGPPLGWSAIELDFDGFTSEFRFVSRPAGTEYLRFPAECFREGAGARYTDHGVQFTLANAQISITYLDGPFAATEEKIQ